MRKLLVLASLGFFAMVPDAVAQPQQKGHDVRWDLVKIVQGTVLSGGTDRGLDTASGDTISLTGSGDAEPAEGDAFGGGEFRHRHADGTEVAHGVWVVTGFTSWRPAGGTLPIADGIGNASEASAGVLMMAVRLFPAGGSPHDAALSINCHLPGATFAIVEGITLAVGGFNFVQAGGGTLFHVEK